MVGDDDDDHRLWSPLEEGEHAALGCMTIAGLGVALVAAGLIAWVFA